MIRQDWNEVDLTHPPDYPRRLRFYARQWLLIPCLLAIPVLSLSQILGESSEHTVVSRMGMELSVKYPKRLGYGQNDEIEIDLRNVSGNVLKEVVLEVEQNYLRAFGGVRLTPASNESGGQVMIATMSAGEHRHFQVSVRAHKYWNHSGNITIIGGGRELVKAAVQTFVFP